ncbi:hypothetical protein TUM3792_41920 [Shewanella sp. MBTL60-007]|nr:hypothetical protein TUM3792_41920 [Shewanella sp. MBTL60-007]
MTASLTERCAYGKAKKEKQKAKVERSAFEVLLAFPSSQLVGVLVGAQHRPRSELANALEPRTYLLITKKPLKAAF